MKTRFYKSIFSFCILTTTVFLPATMWAADQFAPDTNELPITVEISNEHPKAGETISIKVTSYLSDLDRANIRWSVNGKTVASGVGARAVSVSVGATGSKTNVNVSVSAENGMSTSQTFTFKPFNVALVWQADSYTPPFYKGKAMLTPYDTGRIVALPDFGGSTKDLSPKNLIYTWMRDGVILGSLSGVGHSSLYLDSGATSREAKISVTVATTDGSSSAVGSIVITPSSPKLVMYAYNPLFGVLYNTALLGSFKLDNKEFSATAVPYFFNAPAQTSPFVHYDWIMNGLPISGVIGDTLTLRNDATSTGASDISVTATNIAVPQRETAKTSFSVKF